MLLELPHGKTESVDEVGMGIAFDGETLKHHAVVAGCRCSDGTIRIFAGEEGYWDTMVTEAVNLKDLYEIRRAYVSPEPADLLRTLRSWDGLAQYKTRLDEFSTRRVPARHPSYWPHFRSVDLTCALIPAPERLTLDYMAALVRLEQSMVKDRVILQAGRKFQHVKFRKLADVIKDPRLTAIVYCVELLAPVESAGRVVRDSIWYPNRRR